MGCIRRGRILLLTACLALAACSRSGSLYGDVVVQAPPGAGNPAARLGVRLIPATAAFERDWTAALAAFREELAPARRAAQEAASELDQARLAWDRAIGAPRGRRRDAGKAAREQELWRQVRASERRLTQARRREWEVASKHDLLGAALLERHTAQEVQTDGAGHYVFAAPPAGPAYLYARVAQGARSLVWFHGVQVRPGAQQVDLTEANSRDWPFVP
ncbi:MAG TPA: hypothetical protein VLT62_20875 [Candidatus Methylomirabilis sp.]|nr:hypothetical protein [Candidatus Methylomirabilis sp.]